ncbi:MAG: hypothetical protein WB473_10810, partial [Pedococcus sp.]
MGTAGGDKNLRIDLVRRAARLTATVNELALDHLEGRRTAGFSLVGAGTEAIDAGFAALEPLSTKMLCSVMPVLRFDPWGPALELNERSRRRGVELRSVVSERSLGLNPLLTSIDPTTRVGHAATTVYLIDRDRAVLPGPLTHDGLATIWCATAGPVLGPALELWDLIWASSHPAVAAGARPPFTERQVRTAILLARGAKDA